jgi:hypothetical protein
VRDTRVAESQIADIIGLELMRVDIEHAGYGLPWSFGSSFAYAEAAGQTDFPVAGLDPADFNDGTVSAPSAPPRALVASNNTGFNSSDYLAVKATNIGSVDAARKWSHVTTGGTPLKWETAADNLLPGDKVIVISPVFGGNSDQQLVASGTNWFANYSSNDVRNMRNFYPTEPNQKYFIYGIDPGSTLRMPFNRADFYIRQPDGMSSKYQRCAAGTGILYKGGVSHADGSITELPLLDCVADMQVVFGLDSNDDGAIDLHSDANGLAALTTAQIRNQVKTVWVFVLAQEGARDNNFTYPSSTVDVGDTFNGVYYGKDNFGLSAITDWQRYRWKVRTIVIKPKNL